PKDDGEPSDHDRRIDQAADHEEIAIGQFSEGTGDQQEPHRFRRRGVSQPWCDSGVFFRKRVPAIPPAVASAAPGAVKYWPSVAMPVRQRISLQERFLWRSSAGRSL